ncbi:MAG: hypothetical protein KC618_09255, partial [Candidatus Omnitrophica bacterium]|nr:hypothetical protein [Candidatus Omnitrophota bacterium]
MKAPYFEGSYKTALIKSLAHLNLKFDRFNKLSNKIVYRWTFGIEQGISNIRTAIADNRPDIWKEYLALINDNKNFDKKRTRELKESFYSISSADFVSWGLGASLSLKSAPYFEGSYIKAVTDSFKELDLNPYAFDYKLDSEENGIKSVQAALERYESDLWEEYQSYLKNPSAFDTKRLKNLKNRIYNIQSAHFLIWGFGEYTFSDEHPYFKHSYITALQKSFSELDLNSYAFAYKYGTKEDAMNSIQAALERYEPELWNEYNQFVSDPDAFTKEELNNLKDRIYNLTSYHFELWGLTEVLRNPYFGNSYVTALQSAFNQIE